MPTRIVNRHKPAAWPAAGRALEFNRSGGRLAFSNPGRFPWNWL